MIADIEANEKLSPIATKLFMRGRKLNISLVFMSQSNFKALKDIWLNSTQYFIMKIINKRELQQIALTHSSDMEFYNFMKLYKDYPNRDY